MAEAYEQTQISYSDYIILGVLREERNWRSILAKKVIHIQISNFKRPSEWR